MPARVASTIPAPASFPGMLAVAAMLAAGLGAVLPGPAAADMDAQQAAQGRQLAEQRCSRCHGLGRGDSSPMADAPPFAEVVKIYPPESLEEALAEGIMVGHDQMPAFEFSAEDVQRFIAYLKSLE
jgi:cytochrome c